MNKEVKVVLLGDSGVGKSSILLRFCQNEFKVSHDSTLGAAFMSKTIEVNNHQIKFQIWDTAGQEKYKSLTPLYYRDAQVAIIVYDITSRDSFETLRNWVEELKQHGPKKICQVLVGNKQDLIEEEKVMYDDSYSYSKQIGAMLKLTSCKENKGVNEMFHSIGEQLLQQEQDQSNAPPKRNPQDKPSVIVGNQPQKKQKEGGCC